MWTSTSDRTLSLLLALGVVGGAAWVLDTVVGGRSVLAGAIGVAVSLLLVVSTSAERRRRRG